ncbi:SDR family NAD(P)-dependent oxidoreductase [Pedobacter psychroterrae]|uniref:SDR family NAD(P)-dependent oxidoreductase n=1 Tax=Pedobacter psychroterrae TaxID=2530453 RepID=A0A4R0NKN2_9SPHI|nr:SDR family NAD(P)-dependent oxidoreductase [Pedobacter psychroterrae]TCD01281.1 SDR family NAD(P)-dependent oxidoreductase [Pedobacter psychroterrae]
MSKIILITGASRGFGRIWAEEFLKRGDKVVATARDINALSNLKEIYGDLILPLELDVNDRKQGIDVVVKTRAHFGRIDILINNAGYGVFGAVEETTEKQARELFETNFFGLLWLTQAVLPVMREQKSGHIIQVSSFLGITTLPALGLYNATKFAVEGLSETLASEVKGFGIKISLVEPNGFSTEWGSASAVQTIPMPEYQPIKDAIFGNPNPDLFGDPKATAEAILQLADAENPPLRLLLGKVAYPAVREAYQRKMDEWEQWKEVSDKAHGI